MLVFCHPSALRARPRATRARRRQGARLASVLAAWLVAAPAIADPAEAFLGENTAVPVSVVGIDDAPICPNFSFSQIPDQPTQFLSKVKAAKGDNLCGGAWGLALFRFDWRTHVMTMLHPVLEVPVQHQDQTILVAFDPTAERYRGELWVAFECAGRHVAGSSACVAPLSTDQQRLDTARLSIPVSGEDADARSGFLYSTSAPKLLAYQGRLYLFWSAIRIDKATQQQSYQEERGVELLPQPDGTLMAKGSPHHWLPSHAPPRDVAVLSPAPNDPLGDASVDTGGFFRTPQGVLALSAVGGRGPDGPCVRPRDKVAGCYRLQINRTTGDPLRPDAFAESRAVAPSFAANPVEYPRVAVDPNGRAYLFAAVHPPYAAPKGQGVIQRQSGDGAFMMMPLPLDKLVFK
jgi:hypothetical protein